jgi:hypothetical protein
MPGYNKDVWFSTRAIINIITLSSFIQQYRVTYDSDDKMCVVHRESQGKPNMEFCMHKCGLHFYDLRNENHLAFINTVSENKEGFTKRQIKGAELAQTLHKTLSDPSKKDFKWVIRSNHIKDCPVIVQYIDVALKIWGNNISALKGKTTRRKTIPVAREFVKVPLESMKLHKKVFLTTGISFVTKNTFFFTLSRNITFTAVNHLTDRTVLQIFKAFKEIYQYYLQRGFHTTVVHADGEFAPLKPLIESIPGGTVVNLVSTNEHVPEIERCIRLVKERFRDTWHSLPFERLPKIMTVHIVLNVVKPLNFFSTKGEVSETMSPKTIMSGETLNYKKHLSLHIGQYCQVCEEENPHNSQLAHTKGAISLVPSGNLQGGFKFMALNTGKKILCRSWDIIPMPYLVIARVNALGSDQHRQMTFTDRHGCLIGDIEIPGVDYDEEQEDHFPGVALAIYDDIEIPGMDVAGPEASDKAPAPQVEINDLDTPQDDPAPIDVATPQEASAPAMPTLVITPAHAPGLRRST